MGKLASLVIPKVKVSVGEGEIEVRGLSLTEITELGAEYRPQIEAIFEQKKQWIDVIKESPVLLAKMIACAADEPDDWEAIKKWPFGIQLDALSKIWEATAVDAQTLGKILSDVIGGVESMADIVAMSPIPIGSEKQKSQQND